MCPLIVSWHVVFWNTNTLSKAASQNSVAAAFITQTAVFPRNICPVTVILAWKILFGSFECKS